MKLTKIQCTQLCAIACGYAVHARGPDDSVQVSKAGQCKYFEDPFTCDHACMEIITTAPEIAAAVLQAVHAIEKAHRGPGAFDKHEYNKHIVETVAYATKLMLEQEKITWRPL